MIIVFDNDVAGTEKYNLSFIVNKSSNLVVCKLPLDREFETFKTIGPSGENIEDINNRAVAIECFLDFNSVQIEPCVRWTSYSEKSNEYQGELVSKDKYVRAFKKANILNSSYDSRKLQKLIDYLITVWIDR